MAQKLLGPGGNNKTYISLRDMAEAALAEIGEQAMRILIVRVATSSTMLAGTRRMSLSRPVVPEDVMEISLTSETAEEAIPVLQSCNDRQFLMLVQPPAGLERQFPAVVPSMRDPLGVLVMQFAFQATVPGPAFAGQYGLACINFVTATLGTAMSMGEESIGHAAASLENAVSVINKALPIMRDFLAHQPESHALVLDAARLMELDNVLEHLAARIIVMAVPDEAQLLDMIVTALRRVGRRRMRSTELAREALRVEALHRADVAEWTNGCSEAGKARSMTQARSGYWPGGHRKSTARGRAGRTGSTGSKGGPSHATASRPWRSGGGGRGSITPKATRYDPWPESHPLKTLPGSTEPLPPLLSPERQRVLEQAAAGASLLETPNTLVFMTLLPVAVRWMKADRRRLRGQLFDEASRAPSVAAPTTASSARPSSSSSDSASCRGDEFRADHSIRAALHALHSQIQLMPKSLMDASSLDEWLVIKVMTGARLPLFDLEQASGHELVAIAAELKAQLGSHSSDGAAVLHSASTHTATPEDVNEAVATFATLVPMCSLLRAEHATASSCSAVGPLRAQPASKPIASEAASVASDSASVASDTASVASDCASVATCVEFCEASVNEAAEALAIARGMIETQAVTAGSASATAARCLQTGGSVGAAIDALLCRAHSVMTGRMKEILQSTIAAEMIKEAGCGVEGLYPKLCSQSSVTAVILASLPISPEMPRIDGSTQLMCRVTAVDVGAGFRAAASPGEDATFSDDDDEEEAAAAAADSSVAPRSSKLSAAALLPDISAIALFPCRIGEPTGLVFDAPGKYCIKYQPLGLLCGTCDEVRAPLATYKSAMHAANRNRPHVAITFGSSVDTKFRSGASQFSEAATSSGGEITATWTPMTDSDVPGGREGLNALRKESHARPFSSLRGKLTVQSGGVTRTLYMFLRAKSEPRITVAWLSCSVSIVFEGCEDCEDDEEAADE